MRMIIYIQNSETPGRFEATEKVSYLILLDELTDE